jgi:hypothetical protein
MLERRVIIIPDIRLDPRVPLNAYLSTFVASMSMAPIGRGDPVAAIGAYWRSTAPIEDDALALLDMLAKGAGAQLERLAAENVKRVVRGAADDQSPWEIASFLELKTVWHPIGV